MENEGATEVYSWGNGFNYQLGTGTSGIQRRPCRVDALSGLDVKSVAAAKFHSVALSTDGSIHSWGFGRGGRLGHPDFDIHRLVALFFSGLEAALCSYLHTYHPFEVFACEVGKSQ